MSVMNENGNMTWINPVGQVHRTNGLAVEYSNGSDEWFIQDVQPLLRGQRR